MPSQHKVTPFAHIALAFSVAAAALIAYAIISLGASIERSAASVVKSMEVIYALKFECHRQGWKSFSCNAVFRDEAGIGRV